MITKLNDYIKQYKLNEDHENGFIHINKFTETMKKFYDFLDANIGLMDNNTKYPLVEAILSLNNAWRWECNAHGVKYTKYYSNAPKADVMTINDFSVHFIEFYDFISKNSQYIDDTAMSYLKSAFKLLDEAWKNETEAHGVDFKKYNIGINESKKTKEKIKGGLADGMSLSDIAKKHDIKLSVLTPQYKKGLKVEMEHTTSKKVAAEIVKDHLFEDPKYYTKLKKVEKD